METSVGRPAFERKFPRLRLEFEMDMGYRWKSLKTKPQEDGSPG